MVPLTISQTLEQSVEPTADLIERLNPGAAHVGVTNYVGGQSALQAEQSEESQKGASTAGGVSLPVILILLLAVFGSSS